MPGDAPRAGDRVRAGVDVRSLAGLRDAVFLGVVLELSADFTGVDAEADMDDLVGVGALLRDDVGVALGVPRVGVAFAAEEDVFLAEDVGVAPVRDDVGRSLRALLLRFLPFSSASRALRSIAWMRRLRSARRLLSSASSRDLVPGWRLSACSRLALSERLEPVRSPPELTELCVAMGGVPFGEGVRSAAATAARFCAAEGELRLRSAAIALLVASLPVGAMVRGAVAVIVGWGEKGSARVARAAWGEGGGCGPGLTPAGVRACVCAFSTHECCGACV